MPEKSSFRRLGKFVADDSMTIALFGLFLVCIVGHRQLPRRSLSNWQAAILQLALLVAFSSVLRQKGAAHSRKEHPPNHRTLDWKFGPRPTVPNFLFANSLSLMFSASFVIIFILHLLFRERKYNENLALQHW